MQVSKILAPEAVKVLSRTTSKKKLFCDLAAIAEAAYGIPADRALTGLQERETLGCTAVGDGVALPHARLDELEGVRCVFLRLEQPIDFDAVDRKPVDLICALFAPEGAGVAHLKALALVSRTLRDAALCAKLRANDDPALLHTILTETTASQAA